MSDRIIYGHKRNPLYIDNYRPCEYTIDNADLYINLDVDNAEVTSTLDIRRNPEVEDLGGPLILDGEDITLKTLEIFENGAWRELDRQEFFVTDKNLTIKRPPEGEFKLRVVNEFSPKENTKLEGIYEAGGNIMSQCEAQGFRRITYYLDRPDVLATFDVTLEADKEKFPILLSNGNGDYQKPEDLGNGRHKVSWQDPWPKPAYLFATVAGDLKVLEDTFTTMNGKKVDLRIFVEPGYEGKIDWAMESVKRSMKWDEERYGLEYDLDCFHVVATNKFNAGAMENKGLNIFNLKYLVGDPETSTDEQLKAIEAVIAHEYFHNYSGNRVTVRDWFELTLKEGLTVLRDRQFTADMHSAAIKTIDDALDMKGYQFSEDSGPSSHPIRPGKVEVFDNIYSGTVYEKGSHVLGMIHTIVGEELWRSAMDAYFDKFDGQAVTCDDFVDNMQEVTGVDLTQFRRWYKQSGTPEVSYEGEYDVKAGVYRLTLKQVNKPTADQEEKEPLHIPVRVGLIGADGNDLDEQVLELKGAEQTFEFKVSEEPKALSVLRGFSAPVKITTEPSDEELVFRMAHDSDPYNKYEASERFKLKVIHKLVADFKAGKELKLDQTFLDAYKANLDKALEGDMELTAKILGLPDFGVIEQTYEKVDPVAIEEVTDFIKATLAEKFAVDFDRLYTSIEPTKKEEYSLAPAQVGKRKLRNLSASYLAKLETPAVVDLLRIQTKDAENMTEGLGGLQALTTLKENADLAEGALNMFYKRFKDDSNVVDTWLRLSAGRETDAPLESIKALTEHEAFSWDVPNKVRSVLGGFVAGRRKDFHNMDGSGYDFVADMAIKLNSINPRFGSRVAAVLKDAARYEADRRKLVVERLERIMKTPDLDAAIKEVVGNALEAAAKADAAEADTKAVANFNKAVEPGV